MFEVQVSQEFAAAHWLKDYPGNCREIHGHTWKVEVSLSGRNLDSLGMLVDFREVKRVLGSIVDRYDHQLLNKLEPFNRINPTAENIAHLVYEEMKSAFSECKIDWVRVWENRSASACYRGEE